MIYTMCKHSKMKVFARTCALIFICYVNFYKIYVENAGDAVSFACNLEWVLRKRELGNRYGPF